MANTNSSAGSVPIRLFLLLAADEHSYRCIRRFCRSLHHSAKYHLAELPRPSADTR